MRRTVPPSAEIEAQIDQLLAVGVGDNRRESLSALAKARRPIDHSAGGRGRVRRPAAPGPVSAPAPYQRGLRNYEAGCATDFARAGCRPPRGADRDPAGPEAAETFDVKAVPRDAEAVADRAPQGAGDRRVRARPLDARRRVAVRAGRAGQAVEVDRVADLRGAPRALRGVQAPHLYETRLVALFLDATFISVRPSGPKEGVLVAWGFTEEGERVLLEVMLGMRESYGTGRRSGGP